MKLWLICLGHKASWLYLITMLASQNGAVLMMMAMGSLETPTFAQGVATWSCYGSQAFWQQSSGTSKSIN